MLRVFTLPVPVETPHGRCLARYGIEPSRAGDPWWVIYRDTAGHWLTTMANDAPQAAAGHGPESFPAQAAFM